MQNARILIVDDDEHWIKTFRMLLSGKVTSIDSAQSLPEAIDLIERRYFNVAIVDLRLNDDDPSDNSGMEFLAAAAQRGLGEVLSPIMCTAYGNLTNAIEALRDYHVVDFINKGNFRAESLVLAVNKAVVRQQSASLLRIEVEGGQPLPSVFAVKEWAKRENPEELAAELHDLLCRLFPRADHLWIRPLAAGQSGAGVLEVEPTYGATAGEIDIVKFGKREKIRREIDNYTEYVDLYVSNQSSTKVDGAQGRVMGAVRYRLIGAGSSRAESLADRLRGHDVTDICAVLDNLISVTCHRWYENREQPRRYRDLVALYTEGLHILWDEVWQGAARCGVDVSGLKIVFPGIAGDFVHPRHWLMERNYVYSHRVWLAVTHGDLNEHNVLVSTDRRCWIIDFYRTGKGHILRDFVALEVAIKFASTHLWSYLDQAHLESVLLSQKSFDEGITCDPEAPYAFAAKAIAHLRSLAGEVLGLERTVEEYQVALLLQTLKLLSLNYKFASDSIRGHVLLSASMICTRLSVPDLADNEISKTQLHSAYLLQRAGFELFEVSSYSRSFSAKIEKGFLSKLGRIKVIEFPPDYQLREIDLVNFREEVFNLHTRNTVDASIGLIMCASRLPEHLLRSIAFGNRSSTTILVPILHEDIKESERHIGAEEIYELIVECISIWRLRGDPFEAISSLQRSQWFYGTERRQIVDGVLHDVEAGTTSVAIYGMRRIGKTAFLNRLVSKWRQDGWPLAYILCEPLTPAFTPGDFLNLIVQQWITAVKKNTSNGTLPNLVWPYDISTLYQFVEDANCLLGFHRQSGEPASKFVVVLDEFDYVYPHRGSDEDVYRSYIGLAQQLKRLTEHTSTSFVLVVACEYPWFNEENHSADYPTLENPLFRRIKVPRALDFLTYSDWHDMMLTLSAMADIVVSTNNLEALYKLTSGHPEMSRQLGSCALQCKAKHIVNGLVTDADLTHVLDYYMQPGSQYYRYIEVSFWNNPLSTDLILDQQLMIHIVENGSQAEDDLYDCILNSRRTKRDSEPATQKGPPDRTYFSYHLSRLADLHLLTKREQRWELTIPLLTEWIRRYQIVP